MQLNDPSAYRTATEPEMIRELLDVAGMDILELGCGAAWMTRLLATELGAGRVVAAEVDRIQHEKNLAVADLPGVRFVYGGAEAIDAPDASYDAVFMFKSLHHVPREHLDTALAEIHRVLCPGGYAWFSEPVYWGDFNALLSLFHDEREVRELAFEAIRAAVEDGRFRLQAEVFFQVPGTYASWQEFEQRFLKVTHTRHELSPELYQRVRKAFLAHMTASGAHFLKPHRVDLLRKVT